MEPVELKLLLDEEPELDDEDDPDVSWLEEEDEPDPDDELAAAPGLSAVNCCIHSRLLISKT